MELGKYKMKYLIDADTSKASASLRAFHRNLDGLGGTFNSAFGSAVPVLAALAGGMSAAGVALFGLAKNAATYGGEIEEAMNKTGLGAEVLAAMKHQADQAGISLDTVTGGISRFAKILDTAKDSTKTATEFLNDFGITPQQAIADLDLALGKVFKRIVDAKPGLEQITLAQKAFGRSGADLIDFLKSFDGDLAKAVARARELGVVLSDTDARAAAEFEDTLFNLQRQVTGLGRQIGQALIPELTAGMQDASRILARHKDDVRAWGESIATTLRGLKNISAEVYDFAQTPAGTVLGHLLFGVPIGVKGAIDRFAGPPSPMVVSPPRTDRPDAGPDDIKATADEAKREAEKRRKEREAAFQRDVAAHKSRVDIYTQANREGYTAAQKDAEEAYIERRISEKEFLEISLGNISKYAANVRTLLKDALTLDSIGKTPYETANLNIQYGEMLGALGREEVAAQADISRTVADVNKKAIDDRKAAAEKENADLDDLNRARAERRIAVLEFELELGLIKETEFARELGKIQLDTLQSQRDRETDTNKIAVLDEQIKTQQIRNARMVKQAVDAETKAYERLKKTLEEIAYPTSGPFYMDLNAARRTYGGSDRAGAFKDGLFGPNGLNTIRDEAFQIKDIYQDLGASVGDVLNQMAQGAGSLVEAWVLYGELGPNAVRKMTASILAGLAAQATVKAIFQLAEGFAALFFNPAQAAAHFKSAALYGIVAAGAAVAGRAIAGDSFKNDSASSSSPGFGNSSRSETPSPYSRQTAAAFISGARSGDVAISPAIRESARLAAAIEGLEQKIASMKPGEVIVRGIGEKRGFISDTVTKPVRPCGHSRRSRSIPRRSCPTSRRTH